MNIQYYHLRKISKVETILIIFYEFELSATGGQTIAMEELNDWFIKDLKPDDFFTKLVGKARCSDKENYNKKTGRELSKSRMKPTVLTVVSNEDLSGTTVVTLKDDTGMFYHLEKRHNHNRVHLLSCESN
jgi:hypothetical protein